MSTLRIVVGLVLARLRFVGSNQLVGRAQYAKWKLYEWIRKTDEGERGTGKEFHLWVAARDTENAFAQVTKMCLEKALENLILWIHIKSVDTITKLYSLWAWQNQTTLDTFVAWAGCVCGRVYLTDTYYLCGCCSSVSLWHPKTDKLNCW